MPAKGQRDIEAGDQPDRKFIKSLYELCTIIPPYAIPDVHNPIQNVWEQIYELRKGKFPLLLHPEEDEQQPKTESRPTIADLILRKITKFLSQWYYTFHI